MTTPFSNCSSFALHCVVLAAVCLTGWRPARAAGPPSAPEVTVVRLPDGVVQPQAAVDGQGVIHLIYLTGGPMAADVQYARTTAGGIEFGEPVRVNARAGSAVAVGTVRGPHMALGKGGRVHVAWMGSGSAEPKALGKQAPMLYTRLADDGRFEPERNVLTKYVGLDGGGSVAADRAGNVYVAWHAPDKQGGDESTRRVFVARSTDEGVTFAPEQPVTDATLGGCACCGMRLLARSDGEVVDAGKERAGGGGRGGAGPGGDVVGLFRTATDQVHRDTRAFGLPGGGGGGGGGGGSRPWGGTLDPMESGVCLMSTYAMADAPRRKSFVAAWETAGRIRFAMYPYRGAPEGVRPAEVPGDAADRKHPSVAVDADGNVLIAWAEGTGWERGGAVAWQLFGADLRPLADAAAGRADGLPAWSLPAAVPRKGGGFVVIY